MHINQNLSFSITILEIRAVIFAIDRMKNSIMILNINSSEWLVMNRNKLKDLYEFY